MAVKFSNHDQDAFQAELKKEVATLLNTTNLFQQRKRVLYFKVLFYFSVFIAAIALLYISAAHTLLQLIGRYLFVGISGVFLAFNVSHDATHGTISKKKWLNKLIFYLSFNLQGTNAYLWSVRHKASHHVFPNVDGCDADIDDNPVIRLSPTKKHFWYHRYQAFYSFFVYCIYTIHWVFFKDWLYFSKSQIANLKNIKHTFGEFMDVLFWKCVYLSMMLLLPHYVLHYSWTWVLTSYFISNVAVSLIFIFTLIISHLTLETDFPVPDKDEKLPYTYSQHQLATSLDYYPTNKFVNFFLGGFNSHAAHHLFPHLPHTLYTDITPIIQRLVTKYNYRYNESTMPRAIASHFRYLNKMGNPI
jgi:linoleoyl-CoA desaturase